VLGLTRERHVLTAQILPRFTGVLHNAAGLLLVWHGRRRDGRSLPAAA